MYTEIEEKLNELIIRVKKLTERIDALLTAVGEGA